MCQIFWRMVTQGRVEYPPPPINDTTTTTFTCPNPDPCANITPSATNTTTSAFYCSYCTCNNILLGPANFQPTSNFTTLFASYAPLDSQCPSDWLCTWANFTSPALSPPPSNPFAYAGYIYPPNLGFKGCAQPGSPPVGSFVDRFGTANGSYLAPADTPFAERSIPPGNLNKFANSTLYNYWRYRVTAEFDAVEGEILPWFGQPGGGWQWYVEGGLGGLRENGTLVLVEGRSYGEGEGEGEAEDEAEGDDDAAKEWRDMEEVRGGGGVEMYH
ncbi:hypothetical protein BO70DRAFT_412203 [Aspergillus heteromorphus CBS 117.55]|uniref:TNT domain-containing protein n=1 Tax=Aspergillus heteromorphus CBS 117.55 TaxID=1448321 RepID=A0A317VQA3_9EURO|nr:uncharacterized protein BO70DRAFT_412203 [Aspergillus heteromorphus CBS 117.55]PWY75078.1 hypothetical protein BO70DRAFT_412203 [Aspergillus heteromorphus CBS 117.55]